MTRICADLHGNAGVFPGRFPSLHRMTQTMRRRDLVFSVLPKAWLCASLLPQLGFATAAPSPINLVNQAGRLRMLPQRCLKLYLQLGQGIAVDSSRQLIERSLQQAHGHLQALESNPLATSGKQVLTQLRHDWDSFSDVLQKPCSLASARQLYPHADGLSQQADQLTQITLQTQAGQVAEITNLAGRQRMLTQRMAKIYQALVWHVAPASEITVLALCRNEFVQALARLQQASQTYPASLVNLQLAAQQWLFFDLAIQQMASLDKTRQAQQHVATSSERLLQILDDLTLNFAAT